MVLFSLEKLADDLEMDEPDAARSTRLLLEAKNSVMPFLNFTCESTEDFGDKRLPTLDSTIFIKDGMFQHSFYEKPMRTDRSLFSTTALPQKTIHSSLREEFMRRLFNVHHLIPQGELNSILDSFCLRLLKSGHDKPKIILILN